MFIEYAKVEKVRRFFTFKRQKIFKHFTHMDYNTNFTRKDVDHYVNELAAELKMGGKLVANFKPAAIWPDTQPAEIIGFDHFYDQLSKWAIEQTDLTYDDFSPDERPAPM